VELSLAGGSSAPHPGTEGTFVLVGRGRKFSARTNHKTEGMRREVPGASENSKFRAEVRRTQAIELLQVWFPVFESSGGGKENEGGLRGSLRQAGKELRAPARGNNCLV